MYISILHSESVVDIGLSLCSRDTSLHFTYDVFKSVARRKSSSKTDAQPNVSVERLDPSLIRPGKRAFVVGELKIKIRFKNSIV